MSNIKRKRTEISLATKVQIIKELESGKSQANVSSVYKLGTSTISDIWKHRESLKAKVDSVSQDYKRVREAEIPSLDMAVFNWFCKLRATNSPVRDDMLKMKAIQLAKQTLIGIPRPPTAEAFKFINSLEEFKASNGWLAGFKRRHQIKSFKVCGESGTVTEEISRACRTQTQELLKEFPPDNIYNCDETALLWKCLPERTLNAINSKKTGLKQNKERITLMLCSNATGTDVRKPLIIGKFKNPRCFKNFNLNSIGVTYRNNKTAWMTGSLFAEWIRDFDRSLNGKKIALVLDGATSHVEVETVNITLVFLIPNTTSVCQPMDQGIIQAFKMLYRKKVVYEYMTAFDENRPPNITLKTALEWILISWKDMKTTTFVNCFKKAGILPSIQGDDSGDRQVQADLDEEIRDIQDDIELENDIIAEWFDFDAYLETDQVVNDETLIEAILDDIGVVPVLDQEDDSSEEITISKQYGIESMKTTILFLQQNFDQIRVTSEHLLALKSSLLRYEFEQRNIAIKARQQTSIRDFIDKI